MLNISENSIKKDFSEDNYRAFRKNALSNSHRMFARWCAGLLVFMIVLLLLPWTQNIQSKGKVTTFRPEQRPQTIHATIAGRIENWYVREGQLVRKGDTIMHLSEIKTDYFDPNLVPRTQQQVQAKEGAINAYQQKAVALTEQINAMQTEQVFKMEQLQNKIRQGRLKIASDSIEWVRTQNDYDIAQRQLQRNIQLNAEGIKAITDVEDKKLKVQETYSKLIAAENKLLASRQELANARLELNTVRYEYSQKIAKAGAERFSTLSEMYDAEASVGKLQIDASNYARRSDFYYITAPQDGYITKVITPGIGETVKEGEAIVSIMPQQYELAVELYIKPMDFPLIGLNQEVRFIFDGWPAFVFSGWPDQSFGTYVGQIAAIDNTISDNGQYRVLVRPSTNTKPWPKALRPGSGANGIALLNDVPLWYEIWRQLNGFPPDFYTQDDTAEKDPKLKAPVKSLK